MLHLPQSTNRKVHIVFGCGLGRKAIVATNIQFYKALHTLIRGLLALPDIHFCKVRMTQNFFLEFKMLARSQNFLWIAISISGTSIYTILLFLEACDLCCLHVLLGAVLIFSGYGDRIKQFKIAL